MHHPRSLRVLTARDAPAQEGIDQRPRAVPRPRMHHEPRGLVYHEEMLVLENARNGDIFGFVLLSDETGLDALPATRFAGWRALLGAIYPHEAFLDQAPRHATARVETPSDEPVQALPGLLGRYVEVVAFSSQLLATSEIRARSEVGSVFQRRSSRRARSSSTPKPREDQLVPALHPFDYGDIRTRHFKEPRQVTLDLRVGPALCRWRSDGESDGSFPIQIFDPGALRPGRDPKLYVDPIFRRTNEVLGPGSGPGRSASLSHVGARSGSPGRSDAPRALRGAAVACPPRRTRRRRGSPRWAWPLR